MNAPRRRGRPPGPAPEVWSGSVTLRVRRQDSPSDEVSRVRRIEDEVLRHGQVLRDIETLLRLLIAELADIRRLLETLRTELRRQRHEDLS
jgi:hypothetical protein